MRTLFTALLAALVSLLSLSAHGPSGEVVSAGRASLSNSAIAQISTFPTTSVLDTFNRSNGSIGSNWSMDTDDFQISSSHLKAVTQGMILWHPTSFGTDQEAYVTLSSLSSTATAIELFLKSQSSSSKTSLLIVVYRPQSRVLQVESYTTSNGYVQYGADIPVTFVSGDQLGARAAADGTVSVYKNRNLLATRNSSGWVDHAKGGYLGLLAWGGGGTLFDDFGGGTVNTTTLPTATATQPAAATPTRTRTAQPSSTRTPTGALSRTPTRTNTTQPAATRTPTRAPTRTNTALVPTNTSQPAATRTPTRTATRTATRTGTAQATATRTPTLRPTNTPISGSRPLKYYLVDRVLNNADYAKLASWGINTAVVDMGINSSSSWSSVVTAATNAGINIVIWPDQGGDVSGCGWETPFNSPQNGDYIWRIKGMLDALAGNPHVIGIVTAHEAEWNQGTCRTLISDMASVKTQIKNYVQTKFGRTDFQVWNYIDNISDIPQINDYSSPADYARIMDVAVTWQHCAGNAESACDTGSYSSLSKINQDRALLKSAGSNVDLVFIQQTFTSGGSYGTKFTLSQLENYSCEFLNTKALDGFGFYTWNAGWWPDLHQWTDLQPAVPYIKNTCTP